MPQVQIAKKISQSLKSAEEVLTSSVMNENSTDNYTRRLEESWKVVERSRHPQRPYSLDYIQKVFSDFEELKGDRKFADDPAIIAGLATLPSIGDFPSQNVFVIAHQKGRKTKEKIARNFGMARPEGYRKAVRIFELADRFKKPVITLIDTPGAFPGIGAEERGQSVAIAESIRRMFELSVPSVGIVIGEGGSGGALALGVADRLLMLENSIYSVISPESCAAILWGNSGEMKRAAVALRLSAKETYKLGLCDSIVEEGAEGAHNNVEQSCENLALAIAQNLAELRSLPIEKLKENRFQKFRYIDARHIGDHS